MNNDIERVLYSTEEINAAEDRLAKQINADYADKKPLVVSVLTGAAPFSVDMFKKMTCYAQLDFIDISSYYGGTESTGTIKLIHDLKADLEGQDVLIMEDIVDTGRTLRYLVDLLGERGANSVKVCTLLDKPEGRKVEIEADDVGLSFQTSSWSAMALTIRATIETCHT